MAVGRYVMRSKRIDYKDDTKLAVDAEEQRAVQERLSSGDAASTPSYHFICECFFLTAKGLHLGLIKMIQDLYNLARVKLYLASCLCFAACCTSCSVPSFHRWPTLLWAPLPYAETDWRGILALFLSSAADGCYERPVCAQPANGWCDQAET